MLRSERLQYILQVLNLHGVVHVKQIAKELKTSESTIRRDLIDLEKDGRLKRVHGGATIGEGISIYSEASEIRITERTNVNMEMKLKISQRIASQIKDHQCIFIDGGSSLAPLADLLQNRDLNIVTNSELFLQRLNQAKAKVHFLGGTYLDKYRMTMGPVALEQLSRFNFDASYISCSGVSFENEMSYTAELDTTVIKQQAMKQSIKSYLVLDDSKIEVVGFCSIAPLSDYTGVICNQVDDVQTSLENIIWI